MKENCIGVRRPATRGSWHCEQSDRQGPKAWAENRCFLPLPWAFDFSALPDGGADTRRLEALRERARHQPKPAKAGSPPSVMNAAIPISTMDTLRFTVACAFEDLHVQEIFSRFFATAVTLSFPHALSRVRSKIAGFADRAFRNPAKVSACARPPAGAFAFFARLTATPLLILFCAMPAVAATSVTQWTLLADSYGNGASNWRTLAIMQQAMHDAFNAAKPTFQRWAPPAPDEPSARDTSPEVAMSAAAHRVLLLMHPDRLIETESNYQEVLAQAPPSPQRDASVRLGDAIGSAAVARRMNDGISDVRRFAAGVRPGEWEPTPETFKGSVTTGIRPFLFDVDVAFKAPPPPALDTDIYRSNLEETRRVGGAISTERTEEQTRAAYFWASQSSQRGYLNLAVQLLNEQPKSAGVAEQARIMSQLATALADSVIITWHEKEFFNYWRPVTAIQKGSAGVAADPAWLPLIETPPFPEYPSGHAADCYTGASVIQLAFGPSLKEVIYVSQSGFLPTTSVIFNMGQHPQMPHSGISGARTFPSLALSADECANSRIWAGAHFRPAAEEARRLGLMIAAKAIESVQPLK